MLRAITRYLRNVIGKDESSRAGAGSACACTGLTYSAAAVVWQLLCRWMFSTPVICCGAYHGISFVSKCFEAGKSKFLYSSCTYRAMSLLSWPLAPKLHALVQDSIRFELECSALHVSLNSSVQSRVNAQRESLTDVGRHSLASQHDLNRGFFVVESRKCIVLCMNTVQSATCIHGMQP